jgi:hypothetical protein
MINQSLLLFIVSLEGFSSCAYWDVSQWSKFKYTICKGFSIINTGFHKKAKTNKVHYSLAMVVFFQAFVNTKYLLIKHRGEAFLESITVKSNQT